MSHLQRAESMSIVHSIMTNDYALENYWLCTQFFKNNIATGTNCIKIFNLALKYDKNKAQKYQVGFITKLIHEN